MDRNKPAAPETAVSPLPPAEDFPLPPTQTGKRVVDGVFSAIALSQQGASHLAKTPPVPCQDYSDLRLLEEPGLLLACISDGVGSCSFSHWGAYLAVNGALDSAEAALRQAAQEDAAFFSAPPTVAALLRGAMHAALAGIEAKARADGIDPMQMQCTLTLCVYDGRTVYFAHAGDGGIVAQFSDAQGGVEMITNRIKGDEAGSVFPLQVGEQGWMVGMSNRPIAGFVMATDGVLDGFVGDRRLSDMYIYYPFMKHALYSLLPDGQEDAGDCADRALSQQQELLLCEEYRSQRQDDLSLIAVVNRSALADAPQPAFDLDRWEELRRERERRLMEVLYGAAKTAPAPDEEPDEEKGEEPATAPAGEPGEEAIPAPAEKLDEEPAPAPAEEPSEEPATAPAEEKGKESAPAPDEAPILFPERPPFVHRFRGFRAQVRKRRLHQKKKRSGV